GKVIDFLQNEMGAKNIRFPETSGIGIKPVSKEGTERLVRSAINYAIDNNRPSVTLVHKGNIMKFTEGAFKAWGYDLDRKSTRLNSSHVSISYAVFCLKKKKCYQTTIYVN